MNGGKWFEWMYSGKKCMMGNGESEYMVGNGE